MDWQIESLSEDPQIRQRAQAERRARTCAAWTRAPKPEVCEVGYAYQQLPEDPRYAESANALAAGCGSPVAGAARIEEVIRILVAVTEKPPGTPGERHALVKTARSLLSELRPMTQEDSIIAVQLVVFEQAISKLLFRIAAEPDALQSSLFASAAAKLVCAQADILRLRDRRRAPRRSRTKVVVKGHGQAIVGDVHQR